MTNKSNRIDAFVERFRGGELDPHYAGYFECFNEEHFYEAHDVLEQLWLRQRNGPNYSFYKGLIQFAGAFVHLQKNRLKPASALFRLAEGNLGKYPGTHERLNVAAVLDLIKCWLRELEAGEYKTNPLARGRAPKLCVEDANTSL